MSDSSDGDERSAYLDCFLEESGSKTLLCPEDSHPQWKATQEKK